MACIGELEAVWPTRPECSQQVAQSLAPAFRPRLLHRLINCYCMADVSQQPVLHPMSLLGIFPLSHVPGCIAAFAPRAAGPLLLRSKVRALNMSVPSGDMRMLIKYTIAGMLVHTSSLSHSNSTHSAGNGRRGFHPRGGWGAAACATAADKHKGSFL